MNSTIWTNEWSILCTNISNHDCNNIIIFYFLYFTHYLL